MRRSSPSTKWPTLSPRQLPDLSSRCTATQCSVIPLFASFTPLSGAPDAPEKSLHGAYRCDVSSWGVSLRRLVDGSHRCACSHLGQQKQLVPKFLRSLAASFEPRLRANARVGSCVNGLPRVAKLAAHGALNRVEVPQALVAWLVEDLGQDPDVP